MQIVQRPPADLKPHPRNSRKHSDEQITALGRAITEFGFYQPVVVDETNTILMGHARTRAALSIGMGSIPVVVAKGMSEAKKRALIIADNRLHEFGSGWDRKALDAELRHLLGQGFDLTLTGFDLSEIFEREKPSEDDLPDVEPDATPVSKPGDVWILGEHRLGCGSATDPETVAAVLGDRQPALMVTDPPYGVDYDANWRNVVVRANGSKVAARAVGKVQNDDQADWREAWALFPGDVAYVWHAGVFAPVVQRSLEAAGFAIRSQIVWAKPRAVIGRGAYHWKHEPCMFAVRGKSDHWRGGRNRTSVWEITHTKSGTGHSTQKPVEAMRRPMLCHTGAGEAVFDPFSGSGTSLIAAETCARVSLGIELNPAYVDLGVIRWQNFTGRDAVHAESGKTFGA